MAADEIFKHCFHCRNKTLHGRVPGITSKLLYKCQAGCSSPAREVSDAIERTVAVIEGQKVVAQATAQKFEAEKKETRTWTRRKQMPRGVKKVAAAGSLNDGLVALIDARISVLGGGGISQAQVSELVRKEISALLGLAGAAAPAAAAIAGSKGRSCCGSKGTRHKKNCTAKATA